MHRLKKLWFTIVAVFLFTLCFGVISFAADGTLQFSDPETKAGEEVTVKVKISAGNSAIGDGKVTVSYDPTYLEFKNGENATAGASGTIELSATGNGTETELNYTMVFKALKEGSTTIQATNYTSYLYSDESLTLSTGTGTVSIAAGDSTTDTAAESESSSDGQTVQVNGVEYTINENFSEAVIPSGFKTAELEIDGSLRKGMQQESSGKYLFYLSDTNGNSDYFFYDEKSAEFQPTELVDISDTVFIMIMNHDKSGGLPSEYQKTTSSINGKEFTAWQNTSEVDYFLIYALDSEGNEGFYQYDTTQSTYQRFIIPEKTEAKTASGLKAKLENFIDSHLLMIIGVISGVLLIFLIIIIVLSVKLRKRSGNKGSSKKKKGKDASFYGDEYDDTAYDVYDDEAYDDEYDDEYDDGYDDGYDDYDGQYEGDYEGEYDEAYDDEYDDEYADVDGYNGDYDDDYDDGYEEYADDADDVADDYDDDYEATDYDEDDYETADYDDDEYFDDDADDYEFDEEVGKSREDERNALNDKTRQIDIPIRMNNKKKKEEDFSLDFIDLDD